MDRNREIIVQEAMNDISKQIKYQRTWMLFESGNGVAVDLSLFSPPRENPRPIDAFLVTEVEGHLVTKSARRAAGAAYEAVARYRADLRPTVAGFDFVGNSSVTGESGGLAFAIALAKRLMEKDPGPVAATGIVESSHNGGPIRAVRGIEAKLLAASMVIPPGGWVFYPKENDRYVPKALKKDLIEKGLRLIPVASVFEAVDALFSDNPASTRTHPEADSKRTPLIAALLAAILMLALGAGLAFWRPEFFGWPPNSDNDSPRIAVSSPANAPENPASAKAENESLPPPSSKSAESKNGTVPEENAKPQGQDSLTETDSPPAEPQKNDAEKQVDTPAPEAENTSATQIDISGKSYLGNRVASILTEKLRDRINSTGEQLTGESPVAISGEVVVLYYEEFWSDEKQKFEYALKAQIRGLAVEKEEQYRKNDSSIIRVIADGDTEALLSAAADRLLDAVLAEPRTRIAPAPASTPQEHSPRQKAGRKPERSGFE